VRSLPLLFYNRTVTPLDSVVIGQRIAEARGRAGLTQAALAAAVAMDRSGLAKIETGARRVSALELARIADAVGQRIEWFVEDAPAAIISRRNLQEPGAPSPAVDAYIERIARNVEFLEAHDDQFRLESPKALQRPGSANEPEVSAAAARALLGLDDSEPFLNAAVRLADVGLLVFAIDMGGDTADAASILLARGGLALINGHLHVGRRRLALGHELGHYLFADEYTVDWRVNEQDDRDGWESRLDRFARAVLLPPSGVSRYWNERSQAGDDIRTAAVKIASAFRVDMSTLSRRLLELRLVEQSDASQVRLFRTTKADIIEFDLLVHQELSPPELPRPYITSVLRLYRNEIISAARATDLLLDAWDEADLPKLPTLPEGAIWKFVS
jgi:Zn-dependent peptidase ImmA (M78 family)/DNA-binding XRE family transcriptional regulator